jgi:macrolide-specific efflux system membrane fusion protein
VIQTTYLNPRNNASIRREEYVVHLELDDKPLEPLAPNTRLSTRIVLRERIGTLAIPLAALREFKDRTYVRVLEDEVRREVDVKVGIRTETKAEILEGLSEGDLVIGK